MILIIFLASQTPEEPITKEAESSPVTDTAATVSIYCCPN